MRIERGPATRGIRKFAAGSPWLQALVICWLYEESDASMNHETTGDDMTTDLIQSAYRRTWWALVLRGLLGVAVGAVILWRPIESIAAFALLIAIWALFGGITQMVHAFDLRVVFSKWWVLLLGGLLSVGFGIAALYYYPVLSLTFAVVWTAWWFFLTGGIAIYAAMMERQAGAPWGWTFTFGIVTIVAGAFAFVSPPATLAGLMGLLAGFAIVTGIVLLIGASRLASIKREVSGMVGGRPATAH